MLSRPLHVVLAAVLSMIGCGDDTTAVTDGGLPDGGRDSGPSGTLPDIPWLDVGLPPLEIAPCPAGWREVTTRGIPGCDPYPAAGPEVCLQGEAHFPGEAGCRPIGDTCPDGDYATTLPPGDAILYVKAGAPAGGDGSLATPFADLSQVNWLTVTTGITVALAKGTYEGRLPLRAGGRVVGACVAETLLTGTSSPAPSAITVVSDGAPAEVRNIAVVGAPQYGVLLNSSSSLILRGVLVEGARQLGIAVDTAAATAVLEDVVVTGTVPNETTGELGRGMIVQGGSRVEADRVIVSNNRDVGVFVSGAGTVAEFVHAAIQETQPEQSDGTGGDGVIVRRAARFDATRTVVSGNRGTGLRVFQESSTIHLTDVVVRDTEDMGDDRSGQGIYVQDGGRLEATRLEVYRNRFAAIMVADANSSATLTDAIVRDNLPFEGSGLGGRGVEVQNGAHLEATRLIVASNFDVGVTVTGLDAALTLTDALIQDTQPRRLDGLNGRGLQVQSGARVDGTRVVVRGARQLGLMATDGAVASLRDVSISQVEVAECGTSTCEPNAFGYGAAAVSATLLLERFHVSEAAVCGAFVAALPELAIPASLDLVAGTISDSTIGACVQVDGYDLNRLSEDVTYRDNALNLETTMLPVPGATGASTP